MEQWPSTMEKVVMQQNFWQGKKVLVTGHTGFKGSWLCLWLQKLGAHVTGFSLAPPTSPSLFQQADVAENMASIIGDIRDAKLLNTALESSQAEIVFHLAAQSLVRASYHDPIETYSTNVMGSLNLLEAVKKTLNVKAVVMVSTDKCYENNESVEGYTEDDTLGGYDPYSSSKACLELMVASYRQSFLADEACQLKIATARAGNVIGGGDYAPERLIPDILKSIVHHSDIELRYPNAIRPWQHVLEPLSGYMLLAQKLFQGDNSYAQAWNFAPNDSSNQSVQWVAKYLLTKLKSDVKLTVHANKQPHETTCLTLNYQKAYHRLGWQPAWNINQALDNVASWHENQIDKNHSSQQYCLTQIQQYCLDMAKIS